MGVAVGCVCFGLGWLAFGGVRVRCLCVRCVLCLVCLPLRVRPRVCPVPELRFEGRMGFQLHVNFKRAKLARW